MLTQQERSQLIDYLKCAKVLLTAASEILDCNLDCDQVLLTAASEILDCDLESDLDANELPTDITPDGEMV